jgi:putative transposase
MSDAGTGRLRLVFTSRSYTALVRSYGLSQEFITPHTPEQNGMVERVIWTLKEQCVHRHRFETRCNTRAVSSAIGSASTTPDVRTRRWV